MEKIIITGTNGTIGTILIEGLAKKYAITALSRPDVDVTNKETLLHIFPGHTTVIHLAWDSRTENFVNNKLDPQNFLMARNVYKAALQIGVKRIIMASSIHADGRYKNWEGQPLLPTDPHAIPDSAYGEDKIRIENEGKLYAAKGLEVDVIRFGGVNLQNIPPEINKHNTRQDRAAWLSRSDCVGLIDAILKTPPQGKRFVIMYGVSSKNVLSPINPFCWEPQDAPQD